MSNLCRSCYAESSWPSTRPPCRRCWCAPPTGWATRGCRCPPSAPSGKSSRTRTSPRWGARRQCAAGLRAERFDGAILLPNSFDAALIVWLAGIPERIGFRRDGRGILLTRAIEVPEPGDIPRHERFYYLELLRRAGLMERFPECGAIRLDGIAEARDAGAARLTALGVAGPAIGISPGAAYGDAKRWLPERFAESGKQLAR